MFAISEMIQVFETVFEFNSQTGSNWYHIKPRENSLSPFQVPTTNSDFSLHIMKYKIQMLPEHTNTHVLNSMIHRGSSEKQAIQ